MADITLKLPDGSYLNAEKGLTVTEIFFQLFPSNKKRMRVIAAQFNDRIIDIRDTINSDGVLKVIFEEDLQALEVIRHSASHIMAQAVRKLFPEAKLAIGPATSEGFYYDFEVDKPFSPEDLEAIEREMHVIVKQHLPFTREEMSRGDAIRFFEEAGERFKVELLKEIPDDRVSLYRQGDFIDLCRGPHVRNTHQIPVFKLLSSASAYWRGDENREVLQRIYGTAFRNHEELDAFLELREKIRLRDHRKLGRDLDIFSIHDDVGAGLVFWHPKGGMIRHLIEEFWRREHLSRGYEFVYTPHIAREQVFEVSGHLENYAESMYAPLLIDQQPYRLKPMNCPGHIKIYQSRLRSYRDLPIRYCELGTVYRYERSGTLHGMLRVRGFTQDDAHVFCTPEQLSHEVYKIIELVDVLMTAFGYTYEIYLATRPEKYLGSDEEWELATQALRQALDRWGQPYQMDEGGGVFYAPKIDVKLTDALGRHWQGPTIQVDLNLPKRFGVKYIGEDNTDHEAIMIHRAVLGSMERFIGGLIEHYGGAFPMWLAPVQAVIMPITDKQLHYADQIRDALSNAGFRVFLDERNEKLGFKIREAQLEKVPYMIVVGEREAENSVLSVRHRVLGDLGTMPVADFIDRAREEVESKKIDY